MAYKRNPHPFKRCICCRLCTFVHPNVVQEYLEDDMTKEKSVGVSITSQPRLPVIAFALPAVFIAALAAGHLDQQDWLTKK